MGNDPLAVTQFDLGTLPAPGPARLTDFEVAPPPGEEIGFADVWIAHLGGEKAAALFVRSALGPADKRKVLQRNDLVTGESFAVDVPNRGAVLGARLGLRVLIARRAEQQQKSLPIDLWWALAYGLEVEALWRRRARAHNVAGTLRTMSAKQPSKAVRLAARWAGVAESSVWRMRATDTGADWVKNHPTNAWFDAGAEDAVAAELVRRFRSGEADMRSRWDVFQLLEGFYARGRLPSSWALRALDRALELVGQPGPIPLGDIGRRKAFLLLAAFVAESAEEPPMEQMLDSLSFEFDEEAPDPSTVWRWMQAPIFSTAVRLLREHR